MADFYLAIWRCHQWIRKSQEPTPSGPKKHEDIVQDWRYFHDQLSENDFKSTRRVIL